MRPGRQLKAVIPGGSSMPVLPADIMMATDMDYDSIAKAGSMLGSGAVIVMDDTRCMVKSLLRLSYFYMHESCGQCTPCREGTGWLWRMVERIENGQGRDSDLEQLNRVADGIQGSHDMCASGDAAAMPVRAMIKHFRHEFEHHIKPTSPACQVRASELLSNRQYPMVEIELDGNKVEVPEGSMVMHAAEKAGTYIPHFCYHKKLSIAANCRMCLVDVEKGTQGDARVCHARSRKAWWCAPRADKAIKAQQSVMEFFAHQPPAGLPDLRPGRRVPVARPGRRLRRRQLAVRRRKARGATTKTWAR